MIKTNIAKSTSISTLISIIVTMAICAIIYYILINPDGYDDHRDETFNNIFSLDPNSVKTKIQIRIEKKMDSFFKKIKISEIETEDLDTITKFKLINNTVPIGTIRYYLSPIINDTNVHINNQSSWLKCDGSSISETQYPDLFKLITKLSRQPIERRVFNLPNLIGRIIRTSGHVSQLSSQSPYMDYSNNGLNKYFVNNNNNNASLMLDEKTKIINNQLLGYDKCDASHLVSLEKDDSSSGVSVCASKSNIPPTLALIPYIKAKDIHYKFKFK